MIIVWYHCRFGLIFRDFRFEGHALACPFLQKQYFIKLMTSLPKSRQYEISHHLIFLGMCMRRPIISGCKIMPFVFWSYQVIPQLPCILLIRIITNNYIIWIKMCSPCMGKSYYINNLISTTKFTLATAWKSRKHEIKIPVS